MGCMERRACGHFPTRRVPTFTGSMLFSTQGGTLHRCWGRANPHLGTSLGKQVRSWCVQSLARPYLFLQLASL